MSNNENRRAHPLAAYVWRIVRDAPRKDQIVVYNALMRRLNRRAEPGDQEPCVEAVRRFIETREAVAGQDDVPSWAKGEVSTPSYDAFRAGQPDPSEWPSSSKIRRHLGSIQQAVQAATGGPRPDFVAPRLLSQGFAISSKQVQAALAAWVDHVDETEGPDAVLSISGYRRWVKSQRHDPACDLEVVPSDDRLRKEFKSWFEMLASINQQHRFQGARKSDDTYEEILGSQPRKPFLTKTLSDLPEGIQAGDERPARGSKGYEELQLRILSWVVSKLEPEQAEMLSTRQYDRLRVRILADAHERALALRIPSMQAIIDLPSVSSWKDALARIGVTLKGRRHQFTGDPYTPEELRDWMRKAQRHIGKKAVTQSEYARFRESALEDAGNRVPSPGVFRTTLGAKAWSEVLERVDEVKGGDCS